MVCDDCEKAYMAAMLDYEGSIAITKQIGNGNDKYSLRVQMTNTEIDILSYLLDYGGSITPIDKGGNRSKQGLWTICGDNARDFIMIVLPYLKSGRKKKIAELAIEFQCKQTKGGKAVTKERIVEQENYYIQARELNKRGNRDEITDSVYVNKTIHKLKDTDWFGMDMKRLPGIGSRCL